MKKIKVIFILFFTLYTLHFTLGHAAFIDPGWGARGAGKGGAFIATADDASSITWNPAALSQIFMREGMFSYHKPYAGLEGIDLSMGYFSVVAPVYGIANFGAAVSSFNGDGLYKENVYQITVAKEFLISFPGYQPVRFGIGLSLKYFNHSYIWDDEIKSLNDPITRQDSAGAPTIDLGFLMQTRYELPIGLTIKNLLPADVGLVSEDIVPMEINIGAAYRFGAIGAFEEVTPEIKLGYRDQEYGSKFNYAVGIETWFSMHTIGFRMGYNNNEIAAGISFEKYIGNIGFRIDYTALLSMGIGDNFGSHRVATSIKF